MFLNTGWTNRTYVNMEYSQYMMFNNIMEYMMFHVYISTTSFRVYCGFVRFWINPFVFCAILMRNEMWKHCVCLLRGFRAPWKPPNITALCYWEAWRGHSILSALCREVRHKCIVVNVFVNFCEYGIYCSMWNSI